MSSACAAYGCKIKTPRGKLMCLPHWNMVPAPIQELVYSTWRKSPMSKAWVDATQDARLAVLAQTNPDHHLNHPREKCEGCGTNKNVHFSPKADVDLCRDCALANVNKPVDTPIQTP